MQNVNHEPEKEMEVATVGLSRNNIAYDLNISPHRLEVPYKDQTICYVFSSDLYKQKFYDRLFEHREKITESLSKRFGVQVENDILSDLKLYMTIEKRGFLIITKDGKIAWQKDIILDGDRLMKRN